jgi:hypothetical protein
MNRPKPHFSKRDGVLFFRQQMADVGWVRNTGRTLDYKLPLPIIPSRKMALRSMPVAMM